jgi:acetyl-CoA acetyltransferase
LRRYEQYKDALADDRAFQKRYMYPVLINVSRKKTIMFEEDEGVMETTAEGLAKLKPVIPDGTTSFGAQTHPADGHCAVMVTTKDKAKELSADPDVEIQILSYGYARTKPAHMAAAVFPAVQMAMDKAGISVDDVTAIKTHNPFAVNDVFLADKLNIDVNTMNNYGCSLICGCNGHKSGIVARCTLRGSRFAVRGSRYGLHGVCCVEAYLIIRVIRINCE